MSIDRFFALIDGRWRKLDDNDLQLLHADYWVDICHGGNSLVDERYYFDSLTDAQEFYLEGWKERQYLNDDDQPVGLDHAGLYSGDRLIHGQSIYGDAPGHEGEGRHKMCEKYTESLDDDVE